MPLALAILMDEADLVLDTKRVKLVTYRKYGLLSDPVKLHEILLEIKIFLLAEEQPSPQKK